MHIITLYKVLLQQPRVGTWLERHRWISFRVNDWQTEDENAVNRTHSRARRAMRTLIPFQAMSPLQNRIKWGLQKAVHLLGRHTSCLILDSLSSNRLSVRWKTSNSFQSGEQMGRTVTFWDGWKHPLRYNYVSLCERKSCFRHVALYNQLRKVWIV